MYGRGRLILMILGFIVAFFLFLVLSFYLYPVFNPDAGDQAAAMEVPKDGPGYYEFDYIKFGPSAVRDLKDRIEELEEQLASVDVGETGELATIDSLHRVTIQKDQRIAELEAQLEQSSQTGGNNTRYASSGGSLFGGGSSGNSLEGDQKMQTISKSLLNLDEDELGPILNRLSDAQLVKLYENSSNIRRAKLMRSLDPGKAALLLRRVM